MKGNPHTELQLATGGKELDLCVWDGDNLSKPIFQAKNVSLCTRPDGWVLTARLLILRSNVLSVHP